MHGPLSQAAVEPKQLRELRQEEREGLGDPPKVRQEVPSCQKQIVEL